MFGIVCTESEPLRGFCLFVFKWGEYKTRLELQYTTTTNPRCAHGGKIQLYEQLNGEKKEKKARCLVLLIFGSFKGQAEIRDLTRATKST